MKRSEINQALKSAQLFFKSNGWVLPPQPLWDVTDFGLGMFPTQGLVLVNLCEEVEYCEKLMYAALKQMTPHHYHKKKKEDIICRNGNLEIQLWLPGEKPADIGVLALKKNGKMTTINSGEVVSLNAGERITIEPYVWHAFWPSSTECIIGEVSTANDDLNDNFFMNKDIGRYPEIVEDEEPIFTLVSDKK